MNKLKADKISYMKPFNVIRGEAVGDEQRNRNTQACMLITLIAEQVTCSIIKRDFNVQLSKRDIDIM